MWTTYTIYIFLQPHVLKYKEQMTNKKIKKEQMTSNFYLEFIL